MPINDFASMNNPTFNGQRAWSVKLTMMNASFVLHLVINSSLRDGPFIRFKTMHMCWHTTYYSLIVLVNLIRLPFYLSWNTIVCYVSWGVLHLTCQWISRNWEGLNQWFWWNVKLHLQCCYLFSRLGPEGPSQRFRKDMKKNKRIPQSMEVDLKYYILLKFLALYFSNQTQSQAGGRRITIF